MYHPVKVQKNICPRARARSAARSELSYASHVRVAKHFLFVFWPAYGWPKDLEASSGRLKVAFS